MPYIHIKGPNNLTLKFLIDTGSNKSFINPNLINPEFIEIIKPVKIRTVFNTHSINQQVIIPGLNEFKTNEQLQFFLFKFHNYFDGLIGLEMMQQLQIKLDFQNSTLKIKNNTIIPLIFKPNLMSKPYKIDSCSKIIAHLPVDVQNGDIYIKPIKIEEQLIIPEGIYHCKDWYSYMEVVNFSKEPKNFIIDQPIKTEPLENEIHSEIHNFSVTNDNCSYYNISDEDILNLIRINHLNNEEKESIAKLCKKFEDIFLKEGQDLTFTNQIKHEIKTKDDIPIYSKSYRYPYIHKQEVQSQISKMLEQGVIRPSFSPWSSPIWIVPKKLDASGTQKWRLVIDYRKLNEKTIDDRYPLPNITEILDKLGRCMYFTTLDLASGFHQIEIKSSDIPKTAFNVENGHYEFVRMPFGLKNAPSTFQRVMDNVLQDLQGKVCLCYMDDIIIFSTSLQEHMESLGKVFTKLKEANLKIQIDKSEFLHKEISFLGHLVTSEGVKPNLDKIKVIKTFPLPRTEKQIKSFLGLVGYYRKFIRDFAKITKPMTECLRKTNKIVIDSRYIECFETCKTLLCNDPILQYPDFSKIFNLTTDASNFALGAILSQGPIGSDKPVCYASRTLTQTEQNYSTIEKELLAIVWATKYFRPYLYGRKFNIVTDHKPLTWLMSLKEPNSKLVRWRLKLEEFEYQIIYKKGKQNTNADALSRVEINLNEINNNTSNNSSINDSNSNNNFNDEIISQMGSIEENQVGGLPTSDRLLNEFTNQLVLVNDGNAKPNVKLKILFTTKKRYIIKQNNLNDEKTIIDILKNYTLPKKVTGIVTDDNTFKTIELVYNKYFSNKNFKIVRCKTLVQDETNQDKQETIIREYHNQSNHRGICESLQHIKRQYYFPNMKDLITKIINNCDICAKYKYERNTKPLKFELTETPDKPLQIIHIDIYSVHNENFLTIIDKFSKFASSYLLNGRNSINIIKSLKHFFSHHGIPSKVVVDNGAEFVSTIFQDFTKLYKIHLHTTSAKNSTGNSPVERFHSTLTEIIRIIYNQNKSKPISEIMDEALITYNNSIHSTTKLTPFELISGHYNQSNPLNIKFNQLIGQDYLQEHKNNYETLARVVRERNLETKQKLINKLNEKRIDPPDFETNEKIYEFENRRNKLAPKFMEHKVVENNKITLFSNRRKVHKQKVQRRKKFQNNLLGRNNNPTEPNSSE